MNFLIWSVLFCLASVLSSASYVPKGSNCSWFHDTCDGDFEKSALNPAPGGRTTMNPSIFSSVYLHLLTQDPAHRSWK